MIPTQTLRERMRDAIKIAMPRHLFSLAVNSDIEKLVDAAIEAIDDPRIIKMADSLEPWFVLRAQDVKLDEPDDKWAHDADGPHLRRGDMKWAD